MPDQPKPPSPPRSSYWLSYVLIAFLLLLGYMAFQPGGRFGPGAVYEMPYSEFKEHIAAGKVDEVELRGHVVEGTLRAPAPKEIPGGRFRTRVPDFGDDALLPDLERHGVKITVAEEAGRSVWWVARDHNA